MIPEIRKTDIQSSIGWQAFKDTVKEFLFAVAFMVLGALALGAYLQLVGGR